MPNAPFDLEYKGGSRNTVAVTGLADVNGTLLTSGNASVFVTITRVSDGTALVTNGAAAYASPGTWNYVGAASVFPAGQTLTVVITVYDQTGTGGVLYLTKTFPAHPKPPTYVSYKRLSEHGLTLTAAGLVGAASATSTFVYGSGLATWGPNAMTGTASPFTQVGIAASRFPAGDTITITMIATDTLGVADTEVIIAVDDGD